MLFNRIHDKTPCFENLFDVLWVDPGFGKCADRIEIEVGELCGEIVRELKVLMRNKLL